MLTRRSAKGKRSDDYAKTTNAATALLNNIAEASYQAIGLNKKKKTVDDSMSLKGEKEKTNSKQTTDEYYDDRLSRDSQLDDNLKSLVSSRPPSAAYGHLSTDLDTVSGEDDDSQIEDEFYSGVADNSTEAKDNSAPPPADKSGVSMTPEEMGELMGDWNDTDIPSPSQGPQKRQATSSPGQVHSDTSLLSVDVPVRHDPKRIAMAERQVIKVVKTALPQTGEDGAAIQEQLAEIPILKQQLAVALQDIANLKVAMDEQFDTLTRTATAVGAHGVAIDNLHTQSEMFRKKLVDVEVRTDTACTEVAEAKRVAQNSDTVAKRSMEVAQSCSAEIKTMEKRLAALRKIQDDMVMNASKSQNLASQQNGIPTTRLDELSENSIFLAGIPSIRHRLGMPVKSDPAFVVSCFLRELEIYSGMDNIVIADSAAPTRLEARAVIIHMRSNFHKRGAMGTLRRELARQKMPDTAVRDCFPTTTMETVKKYIRFAMKLKTAGTIDKFQIVNRRGQPVLQTGKRAGNYSDFQGNIPEERGETAGTTVDEGPWTTVGRKGKKIPAPADNPTQQSAPAGQPEAEGAAALPSTWAQMTEKDFPELTADKDVPLQPRKLQPPASRGNQRQQQLNDINVKLQQLSATTPTANGTDGAQRPLGARNKTVQRNNSRGSSKNNSRRPSKDRETGSHRSNNQGGRETPPPPFQSYFKGRAYNNSEKAETYQQYRSGDNQRQLHEQHHRKR
jgi:hypothetical protein